MIQIHILFYLAQEQLHVLNLVADTHYGFASTNFEWLTGWQCHMYIPAYKKTKRKSVR
jgi:hypothetical protein